MGKNVVWFTSCVVESFIANVIYLSVLVLELFDPYAHCNIFQFKKLKKAQRQRLKARYFLDFVEHEHTNQITRLPSFFIILLQNGITRAYIHQVTDRWISSRAKGKREESSPSDFFQKGANTVKPVYIFDRLVLMLFSFEQGNGSQKQEEETGNIILCIPSLSITICISNPPTILMTCVSLFDRFCRFLSY